jgi:aldehyde dehydrogenase (NAD+)
VKGEGERGRIIGWREEQLHGILRLIEENTHHICQAISLDVGNSRFMAFMEEVGIVEKSARFALKNLHQWMAPTKVGVPLLAQCGSAAIIAEPLGVVLIFSAWNFPFKPMIGAIAAGNAVVLKPSEIAPATSKLLATLIPIYLDNSVIRVVQGGPAESSQLLEHKWDKIFFTGSARVGRIVMSAAAKHLTPVTMELGGKCPTIVDSILHKNDLVITAKRIVFGKWAANNGQACLSPDYLLVEEKFAQTLIVVLKKTIERFFGEDASTSGDLSKIVNRNHFLRLRKYLEDPSIAQSVVYGGKHDENELYIQPTILLDPPLTSEIMNDEIFGPLLPVITLKRIEDSIDFINSRPKPLCIYLFSNNKQLRERVVSETSSGSVAVNDTIVQFAIDTFPFGGVGESGFGKYHGKFSFDTFSHPKGVLYRGFIPDLTARYPPWNDSKFSFIRAIMLFDYFKMMLLWLGLKK